MPFHKKTYKKIKKRYTYKNKRGKRKPRYTRIGSDVVKIVSLALAVGAASAGDPLPLIQQSIGYSGGAAYNALNRKQKFKRNRKSTGMQAGKYTNVKYNPDGYRQYKRTSYQYGGRYAKKGFSGSYYY